MTTGYEATATAVRSSPRVPYGAGAGHSDIDSDLPKRYIVEARLGGGKGASVYRVRDRAQRGAVVVLKAILPGSGEEQVARLRSEYRILSQLSHPGIVRAQEFGYAPGDGRAYFTQDWVEGANFLDACRGADLRQILSWMGQTCLGLNYVHGQGVVHGDLKPQHILVVPSADRGEGTVKIIDFGFARGRESRSALLFGGTPPYMAPEVADGLPADHRADVYSLGAVLFEALALVFLGEGVDFEREAAAGRLRRMVAAGMPAALRRLLERMTARCPSERCADLREVYESLAGLGDASQPRDLSSVLCISPAGHPGLVDREAVIQSLQETVQGLTAGRADRGCAIISGEAGLGKSRVVDELRVRAQLAGLVCAQAAFGRADDSTYEPFLEAIRTLRLENSLDGEAPGGPGEEPAGGPGEVATGQDADGGAETHRKWDALTRSLVEAGAGRPTVLILEDLHLADPEELGLWGYLVRRLAASPFFVCVTYREGETGSDKVAAIGEDLAHEGFAESFTLDHLRDEDVRQFAERYLSVAGLGAGATCALREKSGGNPLYLRQIIAGLLDQPMDRSFDPFELPSLVGNASVPSSLRDTIRGRFSVLKGGERECLSAIAVLNRAASLQELVQVCQTNPQAVQGAFRGLFVKGIVRPSSSSPGRFELEHSEAKEVAYEDTRPDARRELHRRAGEALEAEFLSGDTGAVEELADHFLKAGADGKAGTYGLEAARRAARAFAFERASRYYEIALARIGRGSEAYLDAAEEYAEVCTRLNRHEQAAEWHRRLLQYPMQDLYRGSMLTKLGSALYALRDHAGSAATFEEARELLSPFPDGLEAVRLKITLLGMQIDRGEYERALKGLLKLDKERLAEVPFLRGRLCDDVARAYYYLRKLRLARTWYRRAMSEYGRAGHGLKVAHMKRCLGHVAYAGGEYDEAESLYEEALRELEPYGTSQDIGLTFMSLGNVAHVSGDLVVSERHYREAARVLRKYGRPAQVVDVLNSLAFTQLQLGQFRSARLSIEDGLRHRDGAPDLLRYRLYVTKAVIALAVGDGETAEDAIAGIRGCRDEPFFTSSHEMKRLHLCGWWNAEFGSQDQAVALLRGYLQLARELGQQAEICEASICLARVLGPDCDEAFALTLCARQVAERSGDQIWNLEALCLLGELRLRREEHGEAIAALAKCVEGCRRTGMKDLLWRAMSLLASAHEEIGNSRYAVRYDEECLDVLRELRDQFESHESWNGYLSVWGRDELYGGTADRIRARVELSENREGLRVVGRRTFREPVLQGTEKP